MPRPILAAALCLGIAACSLPQLAATGTRAALSPETVATLTGICRSGNNVIAIASSPAMPASVQEIGAFVGSYCGQLLAGALPSTTDGNTVGWLEQNLGAIRMALGR